MSRTSDEYSRSIDDTPPPPPDEPTATEAVLPRPRMRRGRVFREIVDAVLLFVLIYTLVNLLTARFVVDGSSMAPNFATGQFIIVNRMSYLLGEPQRGDVAVIKSPSEDNIDLIKRVIGLPGETVSVRDGLVFINGVQLNEPYLNAQPRYQGEWSLQTDEYFLLGDNRTDSRDSHNFGPLNEDLIIGKALLVYWPPQDWQFIQGFDYETANPSLATLVPTPTAIPIP